MELILIEMMAYRVAHAETEEEWRCVVCEKLTRHKEDEIVPHLVWAHNMPNDQLVQDRDGIFLHPNSNKGELDGQLHQELPQASC
jgi:hypothetical protein